MTCFGCFESKQKMHKRGVFKNMHLTLVLLCLSFVYPCKQLLLKLVLSITQLFDRRRVRSGAAQASKS